MFYVGDHVQTTWEFQKFFGTNHKGTVTDVILENCLSNHFVITIKMLFGTETLCEGWLMLSDSKNY